ncbi:phosphonopyruvate decarboxylase [uncultured Oscillibacter sp.]|uniref:phosphonopyruvate decarboxylase n=1 Tax=uncultured Oscillibacter sp. TaxID=876091 RepID=UPI00262DA5CD|nr:phosphonopyruvate decarboxylase [uncultured Oscillibacter sp.]
MNAEVFAGILGAEFYTGVPDSQLRPLCDYLMNAFGTDPRRHVIAANEGNAAALAAGYHLATGKTPVVYLQNSGEGNLINPAASLLHRRVYGIPVLFVVGWRGEPGVHDEPQHVYQGAVTIKLLEDMEIPSFVVGPETPEEAVREAMEGFRPLLEAGGNAAFVIRKGGLSHDKKADYRNEYALRREEAIRLIAGAAGEDVVVSTTGKASRELFELREALGQDHSRDFLTVGSMGHASSIALGAALHRPEARVWCLDGDGALLMHMGALAVIGQAGPENLVHVVLNNGAHESVGGMPTAAGGLDLPGIARACGYPHAVTVRTPEELKRALEEVRDRRTLSLIEVKCAVGARADLGRPTTTPQENKRAFMARLAASQAGRR